MLNRIVPRIGQILKLYREKTGQNQGNIALKAGISVSMLSQIERGVVSPSIDTLVAVCEVLGLEVADLFKSLSQQSPVRVHRKDERLKLSLNGLVYEQLVTSSNMGYQAEMFLLEVEPDHYTTLSAQGHEGAEMGYVLEGQAVLSVDGEEYRLCAGDSVYFNSNRPHQLYNKGTQKFRAVWSISPPHVDYFKVANQ